MSEQLEPIGRESHVGIQAKLTLDLVSVNHLESLDLTVLILTLNEEQHIQRCLESIAGLARRIVIVDSGSTDRTVSIANEMGAAVYSNKFINYSLQLNWGLDNADIQTNWVMRLDADEVLTHKLRHELTRNLSQLSESIAGLTINRQIHFMGKWIKHGGMYPIRMLRIWRYGRGRCEDRWMDEHIVVDGSIVYIDADIADINLNRITWWVSKHNSYATREAIDLLMLNAQSNTGLDGKPDMFSRNARIKRWVKHTVYAKLPIGIRAAAYFVYRYVVLLGFVDGWPGFTWHFLQGFWYRFLVDVKVYELKILMKERGLSLSEVVKAEHGYDIGCSEG